MNKDVIVALDVDCIDYVDDFLQQFDGMCIYVKVGMQLFYQFGASIIAMIKNNGHKVFLDLKLHDIPNTVSSSMRVINGFNIDMVNVHALGGITMMKQAREALNDNIKLIAVTQLTSSTKSVLRDNSINGEVIDSVLNLALNAKKAQLDGVVCSCYEVPAIKSVLGDDFICVTPGIRPKNSDVNDQKRVATPSDAKELGSDFIVVGRPITNADSVNAYNKIKKEFL